jgi:hypothetical protein
LDGFANLGPNLAPSLRNIVGFGKNWEQVTKGESLAGNATLSVLPLPIAIPRPGDSLPGPNDLVDGEQSFAQHLQHQFSTLGGLR